MLLMRFDMNVLGEYNHSVMESAKMVYCVF